MATWGPEDTPMVAPQAADGSGDADTHTAAPRAEGGSRDPQTHIWWPLRLQAVPAMGKVWQHLGLWPLLSGAAVTSDYKSDLCSLMLPPEAQALLLQPDKAKAKDRNS